MRIYKFIGPLSMDNRFYRWHRILRIIKIFRMIELKILVWKSMGKINKKIKIICRLMDSFRKLRILNNNFLQLIILH